MKKGGGWVDTKLEDVCEFQNGFAFKSNLFRESGCPILRISNIQNDGVETRRLVFFDPKDYRENLNKYRVVKDDLLIAMSGATTGKLGFNTSNEVFYLNQRVGKFEPSKRLNKWFLYYFLSTRIEENLRISAGAAQPNLSTEQIKGFILPLPPLPEQRRIVGILDETFDGIATAKANAEKNLQNARALFESHLQSVFTQRGAGWMDKPLGEVCEFVRGPFGGSLKKSIFVAHGYAIYEQQHAIYNQFDNVRYFVDEAKFQEMRRFELLPNDLIMSCSGTMGRVAIVPNGIKRGIINQALLKLTPTTKISNTYLKFWMESEAFQDALKEYSGGAAIQNVASVKVLKEIKVPLPSIKEQTRVVESIESLSSETRRLESIYRRKLAALDVLKKSLLHQAFNGEL